MSNRSSRSRPVTRAEVRDFLGKAEEWLETAKEAIQHKRFNAAAGNAIHAGINASDAICGARLGQRSAEAHHEAVAMLRAIPLIGTEAANHLNRLLQKKHKAEYDPDPVSARDAQAAIDQAEKIVKLARLIAAESLPPTD